jgi:hypothetical protein
MLDPARRAIFFQPRSPDFGLDRGNAGDTVEDSWYFDLLGANKDIWTWVRVGSDGEVKGRCEQTFRYFLEVMEDAKRNGFAGEPKFGQPPVESKE